ncbi:MAG: hypothetical protein WCY98_01365 [Castellaniella sp.]
MHTFTLKRCSALLSAAALIGFGAAAQAAGGPQGVPAPGTADVVTTVTTTVTSSSERGRHMRYSENHRGQGKHFRRGGACGKGFAGKAGGAAMWVPGYGPVDQDTVDALALTAEQQALLDAARKAGAERRADSPRRERLAPAADGVLDPHARLKAGEAQREARQARRAEHQAQWLALWDALEPGQQEQLSQYFAERPSQGRRGANAHSGKARGWHGHDHQPRRMRHHN